MRKILKVTLNHKAFSNLMLIKVTLLLLIMIIGVTSFTDARNTSVGISMVLEYNANNTLVPGTHDLTVSVSAQQSCTTGVYYNGTFVGGIVNGRSNATINSINVTYGEDYYLCYYVDGALLDGIDQTKLGGLITPTDMNATYGTGETNRLTKWTNATNQGSTNIIDDGTNVTIYAPLNTTGNITTTGWLQGFLEFRWLTGTSNQITNGMIQNWAVNNTQIQNNAINRTQIGGNAIGNTHIRPYAVNNTQIQNDAVNYTQIASANWSRLNNFPSNCTSGQYVFALDPYNAYCSTPAGGSSNITGSGTGNYLAIWNNATSLKSSSILYDNGTYLGIGTATPNEVLTLNGRLSMQEVYVAPATTTGYGKVYTADVNADNYTVLLLHANGADASTTFYDSSTSQHAVTPVGDAQIDTALYKFASGSGIFDGTLDSLTVPDSSDWSFGDGDFTIDFQIYCTSNANERDVLFATHAADWGTGEVFITLGNSDPTSWAGTGATIGVHLYFNGVAWAKQFAGVSSACTSQWHHYALTRQGNNLYLYKNGLLEANDTLAHTYVNQPVAIAGQGALDRNFAGQLDEIRVSKGIARWTANFTAPSAPYSNTSLYYRSSLGIASDLVNVNYSLIDGFPSDCPAGQFVQGLGSYSFTCGTQTTASNSSNSIMAEGRLTLTTGTPVTTADVTGAGTVYYTPHTGNRISLFNTTDWSVYYFTERALAVPGAAGVYDVFAYWNGTAVTLNTTTWTNNNTRGIGLTRQNGTYVMNNTATNLYLGTMMAYAASTTEDSNSNRLVWNNYNRIEKTMLKHDATASWTYSTQTYRAANGNTSNVLRIIRGTDEDPTYFEASAEGYSSTSTARALYSGIGMPDETNQITQNILGSIIGRSDENALPSAIYNGEPGIGLRVFMWLEQGAGADTQTWYGGTGSGIWGRIKT